MNDRVLVVGAGGFMGTHLVRALHAQGRAVTALTRGEGARFPDGVEHRTRAPETAVDCAALLRDCVAVAWLAGRTTPGSSANRPLVEIDDNLRPLMLLLEALQAQPQCDLLYISSGGTLYGDIANRAARETAALRPKSYYGAGKAAAEFFIGACRHQYGGGATVLRPSNVYGPGQTRRNGFGIIPAAFDALLDQNTLTVWGDGEAVRDYLYIDDFTALCLQILARPMPAGLRPFNASSGEGVSLNRLLDRIEQVTDTRLTRHHQAGRTGDVARVVLDNTGARTAFDWRPATPLDDGLARTWTWYASSRR